MPIKIASNRISVEDIRAFKKSVTMSQTKSMNFLKKVGILDRKGKVSNVYSEKHTELSYRYHR